MRTESSAAPPYNPTSPKTPRREGEAYGGGLCGRSGSPATCLPCGDGDGSLPPACAVSQCARCRRVRRGRALWDYALAGGWLEAETEWAGGWLGWSAHAPPALCFPLPAIHSPTGLGMDACRAALCPHATLSPTIPDGFYRRSS